MRSAFSTICSGVIFDFGPANESDVWAMKLQNNIVKKALTTTRRLTNGRGILVSEFSLLFINGMIICSGSGSGSGSNTLYPVTGVVHDCQLPISRLPLIWRCGLYLAIAKCALFPVKSKVQKNLLPCSDREYHSHSMCRC
jgi:hypothetical protein